MPAYPPVKVHISYRNTRQTYPIHVYFTQLNRPFPSISKARTPFENYYLCQRCWDGGELLLCDYCPVSLPPKRMRTLPLETPHTWMQPSFDSCDPYAAIL